MRPTKKSRPVAGVQSATGGHCHFVFLKLWKVVWLHELRKLQGGGGSQWGQSPVSPSPIRYYSLFTCPPPCQALQMVTLVSGRRGGTASALRHEGWKNVGAIQQCHRILIFHKNQECHWFSRKFPSIMFSQEEVFKDLFKRPSHQPSKIGEYFKKIYNFFFSLRQGRWPGLHLLSVVMRLIISIPPTSPVSAWSLSLLSLSETVIT